MANEAVKNKEVDKKALLIYRLTFKNTIINPLTDIPLLQLEQGVSRQLADKDDSSSTYTITLRGIKVNRKIYQPTEIEAELDITEKTSNATGTESTKTPLFKNVSDMFLYRQVRLELLQVERIIDTTKTLDYTASFKVAENCYVYEVDPQLKRDTNGTKMYVKLSIFSMDKLMTLNKYSKAYVARKLGSGILQPESLEFGKLKNGVPLIDTDVESQKNLMYDGGKAEFIQPYLVQYNESFYDFMVRTSNRCGEFLYFEDGKMILGLPDTADTYEIQNYETVTLQQIADNPFITEGYRRDSVKNKDGEISNLNHTVIKKESTGFPDDVFPQNTVSNVEHVTDEYIFPLFKDKFSDLKREMYYSGDAGDIAMFQTTKGVRTLLANTRNTVVGLLASLATASIVDHGVQTFLSNNQQKAANKKNNTEYWNPDKSDDHKKLLYDKEQKNSDKMVEFSAMNKEGWTTLDYYNKIYKNEVAQQRQAICINMGTAYMSAKLGEKIKVSGLNGIYVVIQIQQISEESWSRDYDKYDAVATDKYTGKRSQKIYAIPLTDTGAAYPPVQPVPVTRKTGPQTAFVTANEDPKFQGRVRIAFPWQSEGSGMDAKLKDAEQQLNIVKEDKERMQQDANELLDKMNSIQQKKDELVRYANASSGDERKAICDSKTGKRAELELDLAKLKKEKDDNLAEIAQREGKEEKSQTDIARIDLLKQRNAAIDEDVNKKQAEMDAIDVELDEMKRAATEHDARKDNDPEYKDIEQDNTVIRTYQNAYNSASQEYRHLQAEIKRVEAEEKEKTDDRDKIVNAIQQKIKDMSTPWIRVSTPMATPGGGSFYRPRVGDEVLVNFDCDNVERPYVVGSLYSKNTLTPDERYYRKQSPQMQWKDVSMSISSPNGHHISFTDPTYGGSFFTNLISPGLGFYSSVFGWNDFAEGAKDLTGGIHIGDRYGIYEIEMLSHKRSVTIKSPFGTVGINAFSGITINAPNGDVKIVGKNITLEAGNKITINSGTNLPTPNCGNASGKTKAADITKLIINGVASKLIDDYVTSVIDLSLIRHVIEVFVRPVDGTLLLKSRKFLKLEAGLGNATIRRDKYKEAAQSPMETEQKFYLALCARVRYIYAKLNSFIDSYKRYLEAFLDGRDVFKDLMDVALKEGEGMPDIAQKLRDYYDNNDDIYEFTKDVYDSSVKTHLKDTINFKDKTYDTDEKKYGLIAGVVNEWATNTYFIFDHTKPDSFKDSIDYNLDEDYQWLTDALKTTSSAEGAWLKDYLGKWKTYFKEKMVDFDFISLNNPKDPLSETNRKHFRRAFLLCYLKTVFEADENKDIKGKPGKFIYIGYDVKKVTNPEHIQLGVDYWWKRQCLVIDRWNQNSLLRGIWDNTIKKIIDAAIDNTVGMFKKETDRTVWNSDLNGQILFSDREDATISFDGNGLREETEANQGNINHLKWILRDM